MCGVLISNKILYKLKILKFVLENKQCLASEIKEALSLGENEFRHLYRQLDAWTKEGLIDKELVQESGRREPRFAYKATEKLEAFIKSVKTL